MNTGTPTIIVVFTSVLINMQTQNALFPWETRTPQGLHTIVICHVTVLLRPQYKTENYLASIRKLNKY